MPIDKKKLIIILSLTMIVAIPLLVYRFPQIKKLFQIVTKPPQGLAITCPSVKSFCQDGRDIMQNGAYIGYGANIASGSAIVAVFDGQTSVSTTILPKSQKSEKILTITLDNPDQTMRAVYLFKGDGSFDKKVKKGNIIGKSLEKISAFNTSLIFQIIKGDIKKSYPMHLTQQDFLY